MIQFNLSNTVSFFIDNSHAVVWIFY